MINHEDTRHQSILKTNELEFGEQFSMKDFKLAISSADMFGSKIELDGIFEVKAQVATYEFDGVNSKMQNTTIESHRCRDDEFFQNFPD